MFKVTKKFISGFMNGLTTTVTTPVEFIVGLTYDPCAGNSSYVVTACERI